VDHFIILKGGYAKQIHHGFEGLLYLFSGDLYHEDSIGNFYNMGAGDGELFNTGQGLIHAELTEKKVHGIRIWIDLPPTDKHDSPTHFPFSESDIPVDERHSLIVKTIVGQGSPVKPLTKMNLLDIVLGKKSVYKYDIPKGFNGFLYVVVGNVKVNGKEVGASETIYVKDDPQTEALAILTHQGARVLVCFGEPHHGSIHVQSSDAE
jgi:redox-sensitive bicupin YhaK (pirin superfamily)